MRLVGNRICRGLSNLDHQLVTPDENAHMAIHQKTITAEHCGELHFEHSANQIIQAFRKSRTINHKLGVEFCWELSSDDKISLFYLCHIATAA